MDMQEQLDLANDIQEALATKLPGGYEMDEVSQLPPLPHHESIKPLAPLWKEEMAPGAPDAARLCAQDELADELEGLEQEMMDDELVSVAEPLSLPSVPNATPQLHRPAAAAVSDEDEELARLAAEMS